MQICLKLLPGLTLVPRTDRNQNSRLLLKSLGAVLDDSWNSFVHTTILSWQFMQVDSVCVCVFLFVVQRWCQLYYLGCLCFGYLKENPT